MVKCDTIDLEVPAHAEVVIEGLVHPRDRAPEGPFGEFTTFGAGAEGPARSTRSPDHAPRETRSSGTSRRPGSRTTSL